MAVYRSGRRAPRAALALGLATVLLLGAAPARVDAQERVGRRVRFVELTNQDRRERERPALRFDRRVSRYAREHSLAMAEKGYLFHSTEEQLRKALDDERWSIGGENVGVGTSLESLQRAFMSSKLHRQNVLRRAFDHMAVGIVRQDDVLWITVIFYG